MRVAVLGTGRMGRTRARLLASSADVDEVVLAGRDPARTAAAAADCGALPATVADALAARPDAVVIASATDRHAGDLAACAPLGVPVLCEKPIALTVSDTAASVAALEAAGVPVQVGFQRRFDGGFRALRDAVADGRLGTLYALRLTSRDATPAEEHYIGGSGGIFRDMHVHDFDLARWVCGCEVAAVWATGAVRGFERFARHGDVDTSAIVLTMADGTVVTVDGSRHDPRGYDVRMEALGSEDTLSAGLTARTPLVPAESGAVPAAAWQSFPERFADAFAAETAAFLAFARDGGESPCPPAAALEALRVAVACDRSRSTGRSVAVAEVV
jgi:myo-inositol 2-dehydrogenase/D-chiro-inositol 1-dehydrogenase